MVCERKLIIMAKSPVAGRVKTRLSRDIGSAAATNFYRHTCQSVIARLSSTKLWRTVLSISPDTEVHNRFWPRHALRTTQGQGDLGERMRRAMTIQPTGPVVLIGTDIPGVQGHHVANAFHMLKQHDYIFGPTPDGGFWLVGISKQRYLPRAFKDVRWSTEFTLKDTIDSLNRQYSGLRLGLADELNDVDDGKDFKAAQDIIGRRILSS
ncbi:MAG: glycosyltransferase [Hyphomicrobiaceae bacterium TMED74]|nr:hypothetical protein [Filomicrobium sp.]RPG46793.1 MAG: glycosyltransferase [Hyphomicrobiaceae bacterium TMED74]